VLTKEHLLILFQSRYLVTRRKGPGTKPCDSFTAASHQIGPVICHYFHTNLSSEKGDGLWHRDREPLLKRLKTAAVKQAGPRPATATTQGRGSSAGDSASSSESSDSGSDDESETYSDSGREEEPEEPSPLPTIRPADPSKALEYDLIKTIWAKRSAPLAGVDIRNALTECWNIFKGVRDRWKEKTTRLQQATEKKDQPNKNAFERRVVEQRRLLESCIRLALNHGHPSIVEK